MSKSGTKLSIKKWRLTIPSIGILLACGCEMGGAANGSANAMTSVFASLGDFVISFGRSLLAGWLL